MARENIQPKADQPRMTTGELSKERASPKLEYRVSVKSFDRSPSTRSYGRTVRG